MAVERTIATAFGAALLVITTAAAAQPSRPDALALPPKLRAALVAEMNGIREGVSDIAGSLGSGDWATTSRRAERIRDSFILKQKLTGAELEALERGLPPDFLERDANFHAHADALARAARAKDYELAVFYFSRMLEGCGSCHTRYAADTLPGFRPLKRSVVEAN